MSTETNPTEWAKQRTQRARVLAALGDPTRLGIMDLLAGADLSPDGLASALEVSGNLLAHHLRVLEEAGLIQRVDSKNDRRRTYVRALPGAYEGLLPDPDPLEAPRVVFVCTHNSARSILAEALWREVSDVPSASAGTSPARAIHPSALKAARRHGLTVVKEAPESMSDVVVPDDVIVSVCDAVNEELGPVANPRFHWSVPDPAAVGTDAAFTSAVNELRERVGILAPRVTHRRSTPPSRRARP